MNITPYHVIIIGAIILIYGVVRGFFFKPQSTLIIWVVRAIGIIMILAGVIWYMLG